MFKVGERVEIPAHYDLWMKGDRFGRITNVVEQRTASGHGIVSQYVGVKMDITKKVQWFPTGDYGLFRFLGGG